MTNNKLRILLTNDDGYESYSTTHLAKLLRKKGHEVVTVVPHKNMSGVSGAVSFRDNLRVEKMKESTYTITGTPCDCVNLAISGNFIENNFDLVISGINKGENAGYTVYDSGTVAAARKAKMYGYKSIAVSYANYASDQRGMELCNEYTVKLLEREGYYLNQPNNKFININIPYIRDGVIDGEELFNELVTIETFVGKGLYKQIFTQVAPGVYIYDNEGALDKDTFVDGCDHHTLTKGFVSISYIDV